MYCSSSKVYRRICSPIFRAAASYIFPLYTMGIINNRAGEAAVLQNLVFSKIGKSKTRHRSIGVTITVPHKWKTSLYQCITSSRCCLNHLYSYLLSASFNLTHIRYDMSKFVSLRVSFCICFFVILPLLS